MIRGFLLAALALFWLFVIRLALRTVAAFFGGGASGPREASRPGPRALPVEDLVHDRVCHTHVPRSTALVARVSGRDEYFCSPACRDKALAGVARAS